MSRSAYQSSCLKALGITQWVLKDTTTRAETEVGKSQSTDAIVAETEPDQLVTEPVERLDWDGLISQISSCQQCELQANRTRTVPGAGNQQASWMIVGEAPGEQEDNQGEPFVGRAGLLLENMLNAIGLARNAVYITNIVKCRPPGNRDPHVDEIKACHGYLQRQIELLQPDIILAVGRVAAQSLLQVDSPVGKMRGKVHKYEPGDIPLVVTYHPAYLLRKPTEKFRAWADLKLALQVQQQ